MEARLWDPLRYKPELSDLTTVRAPDRSMEARGNPKDEVYLETMQASMETSCGHTYPLIPISLHLETVHSIAIMIIAIVIILRQGQNSV